mmetsp:Transcript_5446/g.12916  ORF Transcript_5446/g.12916 Transcript_5446/m.12916 type:complete len:298 (+) Transcript_5446:248-1141(+)
MPQSLSKRRFGLSSLVTKIRFGGGSTTSTIAHDHSHAALERVLLMTSCHCAAGQSSVSLFVEENVGHVPITPTIELLNVVVLALRDLVIVEHDPIVILLFDPGDIMSSLRGPALVRDNADEFVHGSRLVSCLHLHSVTASSGSGSGSGGRRRRVWHLFVDGGTSRTLRLGNGGVPRSTLALLDNFTMRNKRGLEFRGGDIEKVQFQRKANWSHDLHSLLDVGTPVESNLVHEEVGRQFGHTSLLVPECIASECRGVLFDLAGHAEFHPLQQVSRCLGGVGRVVDVARELQQLLHLLC